jgi:hypothetical protein
MGKLRKNWRLGKKGGYKKEGGRACPKSVSVILSMTRKRGSIVSHCPVGLYALGNSYSYVFICN